MRAWPLGESATNRMGFRVNARTVAAPPVTLEGKVNNHGIGDATSGSIDVELDNDGTDYYFGPTFLKASAGKTVTVHLKNTGNTAHTFTIAEGQNLVALITFLVVAGLVSALVTQVSRRSADAQNSSPEALSCAPRSRW